MNCTIKDENNSFAEIKLARPCVDDPGKYIAESQYSKGFSMERLCETLNVKLDQGNISELKCSAKLGVARFDLEEKTVMLYRNGRIDIRRTKDIEDAKILIKKIEDMVAKAFTDTSCD